MKFPTNQGLTAALCTAMLLGPILPGTAYAQTDVCKTTPLIRFPTYSDTVGGWNGRVSTDANGNVSRFVWSPRFNNLMLGDIDGDGVDELIAYPIMQTEKPSALDTIDTWRWAGDGWTPVTTLSLPAGSSIETMRLANVTGRPVKELVVLVYTRPTFTENIYTFDSATQSWNLTATGDPGGAGATFWFKDGRTSTQDSRLKPNGIEFLNASGVWQSQGTNPVDHTKVQRCGDNNECIAFGDPYGTGRNSLFAVYQDDTLRWWDSTNSTYFTTARTANIKIDHLSIYSLQVGDVSGDGKDDVVIADKGGLVYVYTYDASKSQWTQFELQHGDVSSASSVRLSPKGSAGPGVYLVNGGGVQKFIYSNAGGVRTPVVATEISVPANGPDDQRGYFRIGSLGAAGEVMVSRAPDGIVTLVSQPSVPPAPPYQRFASPALGYAAFTDKNQAAAYRTIGLQLGLGADLRSAYANTAVPWPSVQLKLFRLALPAAPAGVTAAAWSTAFEAVRSQLIDEMTALQATNLWFDASGEFFTQSYLVKDAGLSEITQALALPANPDISAEVFGYINDTLGLLGAGLFAGSTTAGISALKVAEDVTKRIDRATSYIGLLATIGATVSTYAGASTPDLATSAFYMKTALDTTADAARVANSCERSQALRNHNQSKPISDGVLNGFLYADRETQEDLIRIAQRNFKVQVWQALAPQKWAVQAVARFNGDSNYPVEYSAAGQCVKFGRGAPAVFILTDPNTDTFANSTSVGLLFNAPPDGLGVDPKDVLFGRGNWNLPLQSTLFLAGARLQINTGLIGMTCDSATANPASGTAPVDPPSMAARAVGPTSDARPAATVPSPETLLAKLTADVRQNYGDVEIRERMAAILTNVGYRLKAARQKQQGFGEAIRLLDVFIVQQLNQARTDRELERDQAMKEAFDAGVLKILLQTTAPGTAVPR